MTNMKVVLTKDKISQAWNWLDINTEIANWLRDNGYSGGTQPLEWWANEDLRQDHYLLTGNGEGRPIKNSSRQEPIALVDDNKITSVDGTILARMYDGKYKSWTSDKRHGHPVDVKMPPSEHVEPASWIVIAASAILPAGGYDHGISRDTSF
ncbi:MAG: hypothetical protein OXG15_07035 [Gammaproteobacteria bacterium]|nr:hypothetical protein [Gammaproteobacteria bacterium]